MANFAPPELIARQLAGRTELCRGLEGGYAALPRGVQPASAPVGPQQIFGRDADDI